MIRTLFVVGGGDLPRRFLLPAVDALETAGRLPAGFRLVAPERVELDPASLAAALAGAPEPAAAYLALPPAVFATAIEALAATGLPQGSRIVVEKPFGEDLESARELNALLARTGVDAYRVDHVLGMETTQGLLALRRAGTVEELWSGERVEQVEILWEETLALEGRAGYYDHAGALRDVLQSHMLQLLALVALNPPAADGDLHARKLDVLRAIRLEAGSRRARYTAGRLADGRHVPSYVDEDGVDPARGAETFAEVALELDDTRWQGTRFVLRAGKALPRRRKLALLRFRGGGELEIGIDGPEDTVLRLPGEEPRKLRSAADGEGLPAYAHVLLDVLGGTSALSVGGDEAEQAWRVVDPILAAWQAGRVPLEEYEAGSQPA